MGRLRSSASPKNSPLLVALLVVGSDSFAAHNKIHPRCGGRSGEMGAVMAGPRALVRRVVSTRGPPSDSMGGEAVPETAASLVAEDAPFSSEEQGMSSSHGSAAVGANHHGSGNSPFELDGASLKTEAWNLENLELSIRRSFGDPSALPPFVVVTDEAAAEGGGAPVTSSIIFTHTPPPGATSQANAGGGGATGGGAKVADGLRQGAARGAAASPDGALPQAPPPASSSSSGSSAVTAASGFERFDLRPPTLIDALRTKGESKTRAEVNRAAAARRESKAQATQTTQAAAAGQQQQQQQQQASAQGLGDRAARGRSDQPRPVAAATVADLRRTNAETASSSLPSSSPSSSSSSSSSFSRAPTPAAGYAKAAAGADAGARAAGGGGGTKGGVLASPRAPLGQRLAAAVLVKRQRGMSVEYLRLVKGLLVTYPRQLRFQRAVDDFRGDDDFSAEELMDEVEALFRPRDVVLVAAPLVEALPERRLRAELRDVLLRRQGNDRALLRASALATAPRRAASSRQLPVKAASVGSAGSSRRGAPPRGVHGHGPRARARAQRSALPPPSTSSFASAFASSASSSSAAAAGGGGPAGRAGARGDSSSSRGRSGQATAGEEALALLGLSDSDLPRGAGWRSALKAATAVWPACTALAAFFVLSLKETAKHRSWAASDGGRGGADATEAGAEAAGGAVRGAGDRAGQEAGQRMRGVREDAAFVASQEAVYGYRGATTSSGGGSGGGGGGGSGAAAGGFFPPPAGAATAATQPPPLAQPPRPYAQQQLATSPREAELALYAQGRGETNGGGGGNGGGASGSGRGGALGTAAAASSSSASAGAGAGARAPLPQRWESGRPPPPPPPPPPVAGPLSRRRNAFLWHPLGLVPPPPQWPFSSSEGSTRGQGGALTHPAGDRRGGGPGGGASRLLQARGWWKAAVDKSGDAWDGLGQAVQGAAAQTVETSARARDKVAWWQAERRLRKEARAAAEALAAERAARPVHPDFEVADTEIVDECSVNPSWWAAVKRTSTASWCEEDEGGEDNDGNEEEKEKASDEDDADEAGSTAPGLGGDAAAAAAAPPAERKRRGGFWQRLLPTSAGGEAVKGRGFSTRDGTWTE